MKHYSAGKLVQCMIQNNVLCGFIGTTYFLFYILLTHYKNIIVFLLIFYTIFHICKLYGRCRSNTHKSPSLTRPISLLYVITGRRNFYFNETKGFYCLRNDTTDKCLRETKGRKHPRVDPAVVTKLRKFFVQHNQRFYDLIGEDLGWPED